MTISAQHLRTATCLWCMQDACYETGKRGGITVYLPGLLPTQVAPNLLDLMPDHFRVTPDDVADFFCNAAESISQSHKDFPFHEETERLKILLEEARATSDSLRVLLKDKDVTNDVIHGQSLDLLNERDKLREEIAELRKERPLADTQLRTLNTVWRMDALKRLAPWTRHTQMCIATAAGQLPSICTCGLSRVRIDLITAPPSELDGGL